MPTGAKPKSEHACRQFAQHSMDPARNRGHEDAVSARNVNQQRATDSNNAGDNVSEDLGSGVGIRAGNSSNLPANAGHQAGNAGNKAGTAGNKAGNNAGNGPADPAENPSDKQVSNSKSKSNGDGDNADPRRGRRGTGHRRRNTVRRAKAS